MLFLAQRLCAVVGYPLPSPSTPCATAHIGVQKLNQHTLTLDDIQQSSSAVMIGTPEGGGFWGGKLEKQEGPTV